MNQGVEEQAAEGDLFVAETVAQGADPQWLLDIRKNRLERDDDSAGFHTTFENFAAIFVRRDAKVLVVAFDNLSTVNDKSPDRGPWGDSFYRQMNWSCLGILSFAANWYRDDALFAFLENLRDSGFFIGYDRVVFTGTSMGAYAACAFCGLSPGATVICFSPQSTLNSEIVFWEKRFGRGRMQDWSGPYADAAESIQSARLAYVVFDPFFEPDRLHADRLDGPNVRQLKAFFSGHKSVLFLRRAEILKPIMLAASSDELTEQHFYSLLKVRKKMPWYVFGLFEQASVRKHRKLASRIITYVGSIGMRRLAANLRQKRAESKN